MNGVANDFRSTNQLGGSLYNDPVVGESKWLIDRGEGLGGPSVMT